MGNAKLHRILRFHTGSDHLPFEEGRHLHVPRAVVSATSYDLNFQFLNILL